MSIEGHEIFRFFRIFWNQKIVCRTLFPIDILIQSENHASKKEKLTGGCQIGTHLRGIGLNIKKNSTNQPVKIKS